MGDVNDEDPPEPSDFIRDLLRPSAPYLTRADVEALGVPVLSEGDEIEAIRKRLAESYAGPQHPGVRFVDPGKAVADVRTLLDEVDRLHAFKATLREALADTDISDPAHQDLVDRLRALLG
jgi:hypothetical protein